MSRTVTYRGHQIRAVAIPVQESEDEAWAAQALIRVPGGSAREQPVRDPDDRVFASQEDAEGYAVDLGIGWVDRHGT